MKCYKNHGSIKLVRGAIPSERYVGKCNDCGLETKPGFLNEVTNLLRDHISRSNDVDLNYLYGHQHLHNDGTPVTCECGRGVTCRCSSTI